MQKLAYIYDPVFLEHNPGDFHPERRQRLQALNDHLKGTELWDRMSHYQPQPANSSLIELAHDPQLIKFNLNQRGQARVMLDHGDTFLSERSIDAAEKAVGAAVKCVDLVFKENYNRAFAAVRPPGHHAEYERSMGFCVFNNVAVAVAYAIKEYGLEKVLIVDWDVHHGNGTQDIFYGRKDVFYLSMHQVPLFPGTGYEYETGRGTGKGYTLNYPLSPGKDDLFYITLLEDALKKIASKFTPQIVFISAGFDAHESDPIGGMRVTNKGFAKMTEIVVDFACKHCSAKVISVLEGGYDLKGTAASVEEHLKVMIK